jgi:uncharacterized protein (TIGR02246 family)
MKTNLALSILLLMICGVAVFAQTKPQPANEAAARAAIEAGSRQWEAALTKGDIAALAQLYSADARLLPPNSPIVDGRPAIQAFWQGAYDQGMKRIELKTGEVFGGDNTATEVGTYTTYDAQGQANDEGKYVVIWKKEDGKWHLYRDSWNSSKPIAAKP